MPMLQKHTSKLGTATRGTWNGIPCFEYQGSFYFHARTFVGFPHFATKANHGGMMLAKFASDSPRVEIKRDSAQTQVRGYTIGALRRFIYANDLSSNAAWKPLLSNTGWVSGPCKTAAFEEIKHDAVEIEEIEETEKVKEDSKDDSLINILHGLAVKVTKLESMTQSLMTQASDYEREIIMLRGLVEGHESPKKKPVNKKSSGPISLDVLDEDDLINILTLVARAIR